MVTYDKLINAYKWTVEVFYLLIAIGAVYQIVTRREDKLKSRKPRYIYLLILVAVTGTLFSNLPFSSIVRGILTAIPVQIYVNKIQPYAPLQMVLDMLPELLFFSVYLLLLFIW
jgi:NADH:ubiquinone oxidoreductase subunit B-like Fe-S oxidoreductase